MGKIKHTRTESDIESKKENVRKKETQTGKGREEGLEGEILFRGSRTGREETGERKKERESRKSSEAWRESKSRGLKI
jgi:hypothetical protein